MTLVIACLYGCAEGEAHSRLGLSPPTEKVPCGLLVNTCTIGDFSAASGVAGTNEGLGACPMIGHKDRPYT